MALDKEQELARTITGTSVVVSASAGAGKTSVLVQRLLKRCLEDGVELDRILAMTFTKAAAEEMKKRLASSLSERYASEENKEKIFQNKNKGVILLVGNNSNLEIFNRIKETNSNNADEYSNSKTYVKDEYCIYNNTLYKANQAINTAEEFTESHWTETTVGTELKSQADSISALNSRMESIPSNDNFISLNFETGQVNIVNDNTYDIVSFAGFVYSNFISRGN